MCKFIRCRYSMSIIWVFDHRHKNINDFEKKKMLLVTKEEL